MTRRVLVIEDTEDNRRIMRDVLVSAGYSYSEAVDGEAGLEAARADKPDLILLDIQLPVIDGYEVARKLKADSSLRSIPIIAVTSYALSGDEDKTREAGCDDYLAKPFSPRVLLQKVNSILSRVDDGA